MWSVGADYAPVLSGILIGILLGCGEEILILCNPAGIAIALCVIAVWCFIKDRFVFAGLLCLAVSLALKPHDTALVWVFFLLANRTLRKRALQTLLVLSLFCLPVVFRVWQLSPHWPQELHANLAALSAPGGPADLSPAPIGSRGGGMYINLQTAIRIFQNEAHVADLISWTICLLLLLIWANYTLRRSSSPANTWLAMAVVAPLSMLPVYHHLLDAKLLLLAVPACAMLWAQHRALGLIAFLISGAAFVLTADLPWGVFLAVTQSLHPPTESLASKALLTAQILPAPLVLLAMTIFFLWVYAAKAVVSLERP
jgi:hypothetical protein